MLERHHIHAARGIIAESGLLSHLEAESRSEILNIMDMLILATDISRHKEYLSKLDRKLKTNDFDISRTVDRHLFLEVRITPLYTCIHTYKCPCVLVYIRTCVGTYVRIVCIICTYCYTQEYCHFLLPSVRVKKHTYVFIDIACQLSVYVVTC